MASYPVCWAVQPLHIRETLFLSSFGFQQGNKNHVSTRTHSTHDTFRIALATVTAPATITDGDIELIADRQIAKRDNERFTRKTLATITSV